MGGVVNVITRRNVNGLELVAQASAPTAGNGEAFVIGGLWGKTADRWNFMISGQYTDV
ncbi:MAG: hypothetical protein HC777_03645, partial [Hyphomonadaceae bacterium]|nr:hypothetical protein [Hyphomonadaceae bacterium]